MSGDLFARGQQDRRPTTVVIGRAHGGLQSLNPHPCRQPPSWLAALCDPWLQPGPLQGWRPHRKAA